MELLRIPELWRGTFFANTGRISQEARARLAGGAPAPENSAAAFCPGIPRHTAGWAASVAGAIVVAGAAARLVGLVSGLKKTVGGGCFEKCGKFVILAQDIFG